MNLGRVKYWLKALFLKVQFPDVFVVFWIGMFAQCIPTGFGGMHHRMNSGYGLPYKFYLEGFQSDWLGEVGDSSTVYGNEWFFHSLWLNVLIVLLFSVVYVLIVQRLFRLVKLGGSRVTNATAALFFTACSAFVLIRSWSIPSGWVTQEIPMKSYVYGLPLSFGPGKDRIIFTNVLTIVLLSTLVAFLCALFVRWKGKRRERAI